jgi:glycosyltransferase involved in cell wall biosynthesis
VGRLSPRKGPDVVLEALALLLAQQRQVQLELCGTPAPGQEAFSESLAARAGEPDLAGAVTFTGYRSPIWGALESADIFVAPARAEPFGNAVVEGQLARRPVIATAHQGHLETVTDGVTGLHVPVDDPAALAAAIARLIDDPALADRLADAGYANARASFTSQRYRAEIADVLESSAARSD